MKLFFKHNTFEYSKYLFLYYNECDFFLFWIRFWSIHCHIISQLYNTRDYNWKWSRNRRHSHQKKLQNLSNYLVFSLSVTDLTVGIFIMPFRIYEDIYYPNKWEFSGFLCNVVVFIMVTTYLASMLHIFAIAIDRFLMVTSINYMQVRSKMHMYTIIGFAWITALFLTALPFMGLRSEDKFNEYIGQGRCKYDAGIVWYFPLIYWSCFMIPMMIMIPLYVGIYRVNIDLTIELTLLCISVSDISRNLRIEAW